MCGIVGSAFAPHESREWISRATSALTHRGPDDYGWVQTDAISLGMTRLAIVDLEGGVQPFISLDNRYSLVFNGQIYNFRKFRTQLERLGHEFRSASDTEVILHGYIQYKERVVDHLEGMFAFAIWDSIEKILFIARDRFGEKPLSFTHLPNGGIVFSSEIKALLSHPDVSKNPDIESIQLMLNFGYVPSPRSAFKDIKKLPPAHYLIWHNKSFVMTKYWEPPTQVIERKSESELIKELDALLLESVSLRMNSDRGVGAWLSGGVDSSLVSYYMTLFQESPIDTFSAGFKSKEFDESEFSLEVSKHLKSNHHPLTIDKGIAEVMPGIIEQLDEPFADSSFVATYLLSQHTSAQRVVVLGGDGGDEAFGGYERYRLMSLAHGQGIRGKQTSALLKILNSLPNSSLIPKRLLRARTILKENPDPTALYQSMMTWIPQAEIELLLGDKSNKKLHKWFSENLESSIISGRGLEFSTNLWDVTSYLPGDLLPKVDMASMAFGLEVRSPFLDSEVFSFGLSLRDSLRIKSTDPKYLLKQLARQKLPKNIVDRPKRGFGIPRDEWLRGQLNGHLNSTLSQSNSNLGGLLDMEIVGQRLDSFNAGEKSETEIWSLYMLGNWAKRWL
jgi:asparagine synthase (glutamine-hydrolysing)